MALSEVNSFDEAMRLGDQMATQSARLITLNRMLLNHSYRAANLLERGQTQPALDALREALRKAKDHTIPLRTNLIERVARALVEAGPQANVYQKARTVLEALGIRDTGPLCRCGHEVELHLAPGMECTVIDCQCARFDA